jgi:hypothetical protein
MSNPTNLQELADSLTASLRWAHQRQDAAPSAGDGAYQAGYAAALADTRATVLAMIADVNRRIANNNQQATTEVHQGVLDGRIEAYEDVRGETGFCPTCGASYGEMDHAPYPCEALCPECGCVVSDHHEACSQRLAGNLHKATPDLHFRHVCKHCGLYVKQVPGGQGTTWVHSETGMVVG